MLDKSGGDWATRTRAALRASQVGVWELHLPDRELSWSPEMYTLHGIEAGGAAPRFEAWMAVIESIDFEHPRSAFERALAVGGSLECSVRVRFARGGGRTIRLVGSTQPDRDGRPGALIGAAWSISTEGSFASADREAALRLELAALGAGVGVWDLNIETQELVWDRQMFQLYGISPSAFTGNYGAWQACVHPQDLPQAETEVRRAINAGESFDTEFRVIDPDGQIRHMKAVAVIQRNAAGDPVRMLGTNWDVTGERVAQEKLRHLAYHDELTALPNRRLMREKLEHEIATARRHGDSLAVLYIDLDHFKNVNDAYGHPFGDHVLRVTAGRILQILRSEDTLSRIGGDEFTAILHLPGVDGAVSACRKILEVLKQPVELQGIKHFLNASIGVALFPHDGSDPDTLIQHADIALFKAKEAGRGTYSFFSKELSARVLEQTTMQTELHIALADDQFEVFYQPQFAIAENVSESRLVGLEALVRWRHPAQGLIMPDHFVPVAEEIGLIDRIDDFVFRAAARQASAWRRLLPEGTRIGVNKSMKNPASLNLPEELLEELVAATASGFSLTIEVTESYVMQNPELAIGSLDALKARGFRIAIDDFGTGYSSLNYLKRLPIDVLKIDRSFIDDLDKDTNDRAITAAIIAMARSLGIEACAEGIETHSQLLYLAEMGCGFGQGNLFSLPLSVSATERYLRAYAAGRPDHPAGG